MDGKRLVKNVSTFFIAPLVISFVAEHLCSAFFLRSDLFGYAPPQVYPFHSALFNLATINTYYIAIQSIRRDLVAIFAATIWNVASLVGVMFLGTFSGAMTVVTAVTFSFMAVM
ncbi:MAG: hypothetical protein HY985_11515 [Magnetospirillum sp.]|nr:hypothetical protein [Magnetospirillum sp.]